MKRGLYLILGLVFGFLLSRAGATTPQFYAELFLFQDMQLLWVMGTASVVGIIGVFLMRRLQTRTIIGGHAIVFEGKPWKPGLILGSLIFGLGWGLSGACPGTVLAMLGEGRLTALFVIGGILVGTWLFGLQKSREQDKKAHRSSATPSVLAAPAHPSE